MVEIIALMLGIPCAIWAIIEIVNYRFMHKNGGKLKIREKKKI